MRRTFCLLSALAITALAVTGCSSGPSGASGPAEPTAEVTSIEKNVTRTIASGTISAIEDIGLVSIGDSVDTDIAGLAQLVFADGSFTQLGPSSTLTLVELTTAQLQRSRTSLDIGATWHRVVKLTAEDAAYEVETPVGVAAVRGTAFSIVCTAAGVCEIIVVEGVVDFTTTDGETITINAFNRLIVPATDGGTLAPTPFPSDAIIDSPWILSNLTRDAEPGEVGSPIATAPDATLAGVWHMTATTAESNLNDPIGDALERNWTFSPIDCQVDCSWQIESSSGVILSATPTDDGFSITTPTTDVSCSLDTSGELIDADSSSDTWVYELTIDDPAAGTPVGTRITGTWTRTRTQKPDADPRCVGIEFGAGQTVATVELVRTE